MRCPNCAAEIPIQQGQCPNCGFVIAAPARESFGKRHPKALIIICLAVFLVLAESIGFAGYWIVKNRPRPEAGRSGNQKAPPPRHHSRNSEYPVEHGEPVRPEELSGHGQLYFVPVGSQAIPVQSLADYYHEKFGTEITVLPAVSTRPSDCVALRLQCAAEDLMSEMTSAYAEIAKNPDSTMIALTDEDIFPRELGWNFTYSLRVGRFGIVSTHRMDPHFGDAVSDPAERLASTRQMLTKYVATMYYRIPDSFDPTSVMYSPLTPDGGSDDLHESDLHSEASVNGRRGTPFPCLFFTYSYQTHDIRAIEPEPTDCVYGNSPHFGEETFEINLGGGAIKQKSWDLSVDSTPQIQFLRAYNSGYTAPMEFGMGWGTNHNYNAWLSSDGLSSLSHIDINNEAGEVTYLRRTDSNRGFNQQSVYESHHQESYGALLKWDPKKNDYRFEYRDGSASTFWPCGNPKNRCYWIGYQDAKGNTLDFDRAPTMELRQLSARDQQGVSFQYDEQRRLTEIRASNGQTVAYDYDDDNCLAKVRHSDGQVTLYTYDAGHRMTSVSVIPKRGARPKEIVAIEYNAQGHVTKLTLEGIGSYQIEYLTIAPGDYASELRITDPQGEVLKIAVQPDDYVVHAESVRFPRVMAQR